MVAAVVSMERDELKAGLMSWRGITSLVGAWCHFELRPTLAAGAFVGTAR